MSIYDRYPARKVCPHCEDYGASNVHDLMRHMADHCPVEKAPSQNLEQEMETGPNMSWLDSDGNRWEYRGDFGPRYEDDEDTCFAGHYESELRENRYGGREDSYNRVAQYWTDYLYQHHCDGLLDEEDVALMMALFKLARWQETGKFDHLYDMKKYVEEAYHRAAKTFSRGF